MNSYGDCDSYLDFFFGWGGGVGWSGVVQFYALFHDGASFENYLKLD